jgi:hypothetical protein
MFFGGGGVVHVIVHVTGDVTVYNFSEVSVMYPDVSGSVGNRFFHRILEQEETLETSVNDSWMDNVRGLGRAHLFRKSDGTQCFRF